MRVAVPLEMCWHDVPGGTARAAIDLTSALAARGDVDVAGVAASHRAAPHPVWTPPVAVRHHRLPRPVLYESWHRLRRPRVESVLGDVDVLHVMAGAVAAARAPLVATVHDLAFRHLPAMFTRHGLRFFERALAIIADEAAAVLCSSQATLADCAAAGIDRSRLHHVPLAVEVERPTPEQVAAARSRYGLEGPYVLFVGTLEPRKNLSGLLAAWRRLDPQDATLAVVGPSGWGDGVDAAALPASARLVGFVPNAARDALYAGAELSVYPSLFEGFGLPVLESMALGCPVVTSAGTACEELVEGGAGVAVDPSDADALAGAIGGLLADGEGRRRLAEAGRARAARYSWAATAGLVVDRYREVVP